MAATAAAIAASVCAVVLEAARAAAIAASRWAAVSKGASDGRVGLGHAVAVAGQAQGEVRSGG